VLRKRGARPYVVARAKRREKPARAVVFETTVEPADMERFTFIGEEEIMRAASAGFVAGCRAAAKLGAENALEHDSDVLSDAVGAWVFRLMEPGR
jgi:hypothetical protein